MSLNYLQLLKKQVVQMIHTVHLYQMTIRIQQSQVQNQARKKQSQAQSQVQNQARKKRSQAQNQVQNQARK